MLCCNFHKNYRAKKNRKKIELLIIPVKSPVNKLAPIKRNPTQ